MDTQRFKEAFNHLEILDERLTHKVRPRAGGSLVRPSAEHLEEQLRDLATYTVEMKEIVRELFMAIAGSGKPAS
jgi:hypothetical protein